jgi:hypothetical protein
MSSKLFDQKLASISSKSLAIKEALSRIAIRSAVCAINRAELTPDPAAPAGDIAYIASGTPGEYDYTAQYEYPSDADTYTWDFGDGQTGTYNVAAASHTYGSTAQRLVKVTVVDRVRGTFSYTKTVSVVYNPVKPTADFTASKVADTNGKYYFSATYQYPSDVSTYNWTFGDGGQTTGSSSSTTRDYQSSGNYTVSLTVNDRVRGQFTYTKTFSINYTAPVKEDLYITFPAGRSYTQSSMPSGERLYTIQDDSGMNAPPAIQFNADIGNKLNRTDTTATRFVFSTYQTDTTAITGYISGQRFDANGNIAQYSSASTAGTAASWLDFYVAKQLGSAQFSTQIPSYSKWQTDTDGKKYVMFKITPQDAKFNAFYVKIKDTSVQTVPSPPPAQTTQHVQVNYNSQTQTTQGTYADGNRIYYMKPFDNSDLATWLNAVVADPSALSSTVDTEFTMSRVEPGSSGNFNVAFYKNGVFSSTSFYDDANPGKPESLKFYLSKNYTSASFAGVNFDSMYTDQIVTFKITPNDTRFYPFYIRITGRKVRTSPVE